LSGTFGLAGWLAWVVVVVVVMVMVSLSVLEGDATGPFRPYGGLLFFSRKKK